MKKTGAGTEDFSKFKKKTCKKLHTITVEWPNTQTSLLLCGREWVNSNVLHVDIIMLQKQRTNQQQSVQDSSGGFEYRTYIYRSEPQSVAASMLLNRYSLTKKYGPFNLMTLVYEIRQTISLTLTQLLCLGAKQ